jgi:hypothetical protein
MSSADIHVGPQSGQGPLDLGWLGVFHPDRDQAEAGWRSDRRMRGVSPTDQERNHATYLGVGCHPPAQQSAGHVLPASIDDWTGVKAVRERVGTGVLDVFDCDRPPDQTTLDYALNPVGSRACRGRLAGVWGDELQVGAWP